jgi:sugar lactone lactonase YvrE
MSTITNIRSNQGYEGDNGLVSLSNIYRPSGMVLDIFNNLFFADTLNHCVRMVNASTGIINTIAGIGIAGWGNDGFVAVQAKLNYPSGVAVDKFGNVYIADSFNNRIRKVSSTTNIITTIAGNGSIGFNLNNTQAKSTGLNNPYGIVLDKYENIYFTDFNNHRICMISQLTGILSTIAGIGISGYSGDGGSSKLAKLNYPTGIVIDNNSNMFFSDTKNNRIRKIMASTLLISTIGGNGFHGFSSDEIKATNSKLFEPVGLALDSIGNLYVADSKNNRIRKIIQFDLYYTAKPTLYPTQSPTVSPTLFPTYQKGVPTPLPTAVPTLSPTSFESIWIPELEKVVSEYKLESLALFPKSQFLYFSEVIVEDFSISKGCNSWKKFISGDLAELSIVQNSDFVRIITKKYYSSIQDDISPLINISSLTCNKLSESSDIVHNIVNGNNDVVNCSDSDDPTLFHLWSTKSCSSSSIPSYPLCIDCPDNITDVSANNNLYTAFSPCSSSCDYDSLNFNSLSNSRYFGIIRIMEVKMHEPQPAPLIKNISIVSFDKVSASIDIKLNYDGLVYCSLINLLTDAVPKLTNDLTNSLNSNYNFSSNNITTINFYSLVPSTDYNVYCMTISKENVQSLFTDVLSNIVQFTSQCCKQITIDLSSKSLIVDSIKPDIISVTLDGLPSQDLKIQFFTTGVSNLPNHPHKRDDKSLFPFSLSYDSYSRGDSLINYLSFVGKNSTGSMEGMFYINCTLFGNSSHQYEIIYSRSNFFLITSKYLEPNSPIFLSASFSSNGAYILVKFDSSTNKGLTSSTSFKCSSIFSFTGIETSKCDWIDDSSLTIYPGISVDSNKLLNVGDSILLLSDKIKSKCYLTTTDCLGWFYSVSKNITVVASKISVRPIVVINSPSVMGSCDSLTLNLLSSSGSGGRNWKSRKFQVFSSSLNISINENIEKYLNDNYIFNPPSLLPRNYIAPSVVYTVSVTLCNFLGACSQGTTKVTSLSTTIPTVIISGNKNREISLSNGLILSSDAYMSTCEGVHEKTSLAYSWIVYENELEISIKSESRDAAKFKLSPFVLKFNILYSIKLTVTNTIESVSASTSISLTVKPYELVAVINGGDAQSIGILTDFFIDASGSYDADQINFGNVGLKYSWDCITIYPIYSEECGIFLYTETMHTPILKMLPIVEDIICKLTVTVTDSDNKRSSKALIKITTLPEGSPMVSIFSGDTSLKVNQNKAISLLAHVDLSKSQNIDSKSICTWSVDDSNIYLNKILKTRVIETFVRSEKKSIFPMNLVIPGNTLPSRKTLIFTLTADIAIGGFSSSASFTITTNGPPTPGAFIVTPSSGIGLVDSFTYSAFNWDDEDLPLSFQFSFVTLETVNLVKSRSETAFTTTILPPGLSIRNLIVTCYAQVFDSFDSNSTISYPVKVIASSQNLDLNAITAGLLSSSKGNIDAMKQAISTISSIRSVPNCTNTPKCISLNRQECLTKSHTCGSCLFGNYIGINGNSNMPCLNNSIVEIDDGKLCSKSSQCQSFEVCNTKTSKCEIIYECSLTCSGHGRCKFINKNSGKDISVCMISDSNCLSVCACEEGYNGESCLLTDEEVEQNNQVLLSLLDTLLSLSDTEEADENSIGNWINSINDLTAGYVEVDSGLVSLSVIENVLQSSLDIALSYESVADIFISVDVTGNILDDSEIDSSKKSKIAEQLYNSLNTLSLISMNSLISGQDDNIVISDNYRMKSNVITSNISSTSSSISEPASQYEEDLSNYEAGDKESSSVSFDNNNDENSKLKVSLITKSSKTVQLTSNSNNRRRLQENSIQESDIDGTNLTFYDEILSNSMFMQFSNLNACYNKSNLNITVVLNLNEEADYGYIQSDNVTFSTTCKVGKPSVENFTCPSGMNITHVCNGTANKIQHIESLCSMRKTIPQCSLLGVESSDHCQILSFTATKTVCSCPLCDPITNEPLYRQISRRRRLSSGDIEETLDIIEVASILTYTVDQFTNIIQTGSQFTDKDLKKAKIVFIVFALIYGLIGGSVLLMHAINIWLKKQENIKKQVEVKPDLSDNEHAARNDVFHYWDIYLSDVFFPSIFSEKPTTNRLNYELMKEHIYLSALFSESVYEKCMNSLRLITSLTLQITLCAILLDVIFPNDNNTCSTYLTEDSCLNTKSMFDNEVSMCDWDGNDISRSHCYWKEPEFTTMTLIFSASVVIIFEVPIISIIDLLFSKILLSPTRDIVREQKKKLGYKLSSSKFDSIDLNARRIRQNLEEKIKLSSSSLLLANQTTTNSDSYTSEQYSDVEFLLQKVEEHRKSIRVRREKERFNREWPPSLVGKNFIGKVHYNTKTNTKANYYIMMAEIQKVLNSVDMETNKALNFLKDKEPDYVGLYLIYLFICDLLGRTVSKVEIFTTQSQEYIFPNRYIVTHMMKGFTVCFLVILNIFMIYTCMLYGISKGEDWQIGWVELIGVEIYFELFCKELFVVLFVNYFIPSSISNNSKAARHMLHSTSEKMYNYKSPEVFTASDYFFVSTRIAKEYPDLMESKFVLSYREPSLPKDISLRWMKHEENQGYELYWINFKSLFNINEWLVFLGRTPVLIQQSIAAGLNASFISILTIVVTRIIPSATIYFIMIFFAVVFAIYFVVIYRDALKADSLQISNIESKDSRHGVDLTNNNDSFKLNVSPEDIIEERDFESDESSGFASDEDNNIKLNDGTGNENRRHITITETNLNKEFGMKVLEDNWNSIIDDKIIDHDLIKSKIDINNNNNNNEDKNNKHRHVTISETNLIEDFGINSLEENYNSICSNSISKNEFNKEEENNISLANVKEEITKLHDDDDIFNDILNDFDDDMKSISENESSLIKENENTISFDNVKNEVVQHQQENNNDDEDGIFNDILNELNDENNESNSVVDKTKQLEEESRIKSNQLGEDDIFNDLLSELNEVTVNDSESKRERMPSFLFQNTATNTINKNPNITKETEEFNNNDEKVNIDSNKKNSERMPSFLFQEPNVIKAHIESNVIEGIDEEENDDGEDIFAELLNDF